MSSEYRDPPILSNPPTYSRHDLEYITTLLEVAAICLSDEPESTFSFPELLREANAMTEPGIPLDEADVRIVLPLFKSIERRPGGRYALAPVKYTPTPRASAKVRS